MNSFSLTLNGVVYEICVWPVILHRGKIWRLKKNETVIDKREERGIVRAMCGIHP